MLRVRASHGPASDHNALFDGDTLTGALDAGAIEVGPPMLIGTVQPVEQSQLIAHCQHARLPPVMIRLRR